MRNKLEIRMAALLLAWSGGWLIPAPAKAIELSIAESRVAIAEDSGSGVAVIGVERKISNHMNVVVRHAEVVEGDLHLDSQISDRSIWVGVDLGTGEWVIHSAKGVARLKSYAEELSGNVLKSLEGLELPGEELDIIVIRRTNLGARVWHGRVHDGGLGDESEPDGWLVAKNEKLRRVDRGQGNLSRFKEGDVVIGFDAGTLEYFAVEIGAGVEGGAS